jgi:proteasome lid subunit RPN8/RPN11
MRLADEVVSFHGAAATRRLRSVLDPSTTPESGVLHKTYLHEDGSGRAESATINRATIVRARNDPQWELRIAAGIAEKMRAELNKARPSETGGLLIGHMNTRRKIVYVTRLLRAPRDSKGTPAVFRRGVFDLPEQIRSVEEKTGHLLGYVGEWHTHPQGGPDLSDVDEYAVAELRHVLDPASIPTLVTIVTPDGIHPHLFEPGSPAVRPPVRPTRWIVRWYTDLVSPRHRGRR